jgi:hypothetical protein
MADIARIKGNISKMIAQNAPETDIDAYVASEGVSLDQLKAPAAPEVGIGEDVAKSAGAGLVKGATGMLGLGGDAGSLLGSGVDYAGSALGAAPDKVQQFKDLMSRGARNNPITSIPASILQGPSSQDLQSKVENVTGPLYKPQTTAGEYAQTGAEFLPGMIGGPGSIGAKLLTRVAAPALASETAGQLTEGTGAEPYARVGGALLGGFGASKAMQPRAIDPSPSADDLLKSGSKGFEAVKASDAVINPSSVRQMAKDIKTELLNEGRHPTSEGQAGLFSALDRLEEMGKSVGGVTPKDMEVIRKNLVDLKKSPNPSASGAARDATESFMQKYGGMGQSDLLNGSNPFPTLKNAIGDWAAGKRSNTLMGKVDLANLNAGTAGSGANEDNALRQAIKQLARPINNTNTPVAKRLGFNNEEIAGIKSAAMGTPVGNAARWVGKAAPTGIVSGAMSSGAGGMAGGPVGAVALPAVGFVAKKIGDLSTKQAVNALDSLVRSRSPLAAQVAAQLPPQVVSQLNPKTQALLAGLIAADPVLANQAGQPVGNSGAN